MTFPAARLRRTRMTESLRALTSETRLHAADLIHPIFVDETGHESVPIPSLPGVSRHPVKAAVADAIEARNLGIRSVLLFGIPKTKDPQGSGAWNARGGVQEAASAIRQATDLAIVTDVCLCEYTTHGHCGVVTTPKGESVPCVDNDATLPLLARTAVSHAEAGAHIVAPSAMMDGQVQAIRRGLDEAGFPDVAILSYAAKYSSAFFGPFRDAVGSAPAFGDRRTHQMSPANAREALREIDMDLEEGADMIMVKPAGPCLDIIRAARDRVRVPLVAYQVSGEYAALHAAAERGWMDLPSAMMETVLGIRRAGADVVITYFAKAIARRLTQGGGTRP
ncbi:MAG: porphobilinogen synthase [Thermoplasmatota archaeon]